eukprot:22562-Pelagococcus_subviridis.AAC.4
MKNSAEMDAKNTWSFPCLAASIIARKNVLSPISVRRIKTNDCGIPASKTPSLKSANALPKVSLAVGRVTPLLGSNCDISKRRSARARRVRRAARDWRTALALNASGVL